MLELHPRSKEVILCARGESERLLHPYVGSEHLFLGLIIQGTSVAAEVLLSMGIRLEEARAFVLEISGVGRVAAATQRVFSNRGKRILDHSLMESEALYHKIIGPEHILLSMVSNLIEQDGQPKGKAILVLRKFGYTPNDVNDALRTRLALVEG